MLPVKPMLQSPPQLRELPKGEVINMFRKLARELLIFMFVTGFIGASIGMVHEFEATKPIVVITPDSSAAAEPGTVPVPPGACIVRAPNEKAGPGEAPSCPPRMYWENEAKKYGGTFETPESRAADEKARFAAGEKAKRDARPADIVIFGALGFGLGALAGIVLWAFYRAARFAITG
jgi:hypothetical protein